MRPSYAITLAVVLLAVAAHPAAAEQPEDFRLRYQTPRTPAQSCGVDSLYVCARSSGATTLSLANLERDLPLGPHGVTVESLTSACRTHGVSAAAVRLAPERLRWCSSPMLLHVNDDHFISFFGWDEGRLLLFDNQIGLFDCTLEWFDTHYRWDGAALLVGTPSPAVLLLLYGPTFAAGACGVGALLLLGWYFLGKRRFARANAPARAPAPA